MVCVGFWDAFSSNGNNQGARCKKHLKLGSKLNVSEHGLKMASKYLNADYIENGTEN